MPLPSSRLCNMINSPTLYGSVRRMRFMSSILGVSWFMSERCRRLVAFSLQASYTQRKLRRFRNLNPPLLAWTSGDRQHALPFADLIYRPGRRLSLEIRIRIFSAGIQVYRFGKSLVQYVVHEAFSDKPGAA